MVRDNDFIKHSKQFKLIRKKERNAYTITHNNHYFNAGHYLRWGVWQSQQTYAQHDPVDLAPSNSQLFLPLIVNSSDPADTTVYEPAPSNHQESNYDLLFPELWGFHNTGQKGGPPDKDIDAPEAWGLLSNTQTPEVVVALIDTGVDYAHEDLAANMWINTAEIADNNVDDDGNGYIDDYYGFDCLAGQGSAMDDNGHGTHVAGTIGAAHNRIGVMGVAPRVKIMALKAFDIWGVGRLSAILDCIEYATVMKAEHNVNIVAINASWGGDRYIQELYDAIAEAGREGIMVSASGGNDGRNTDILPQYPSAYDLPNVVAVAASDRKDKLAEFLPPPFHHYSGSNWGHQSVDLVAPGVEILSTSRWHDYSFKSGTSMAAPLVTGAAVLLQEQYPQLGITLLSGKRKEMR
ncbi:S8 family serine peptidase [Chloroflexi bacterium TSY]|nr:S8 family serine peptidase [Chloroflexi bacterium TSY]